MRIGFLILAHEHPQVLAQLVRRLLAEGDSVVVHLDRKTPAAFRETLHVELGALYTAVNWAESVAVGWGEWSMVEATLNGLKVFRETAHPPDRICLISGADYPIRPLAELRAFLDRHPGVNFIESVDAEQENWIARGDQRQRYLYRHWFSWKKHPRLYDLSAHGQRLLGLERKFPDGFHPHMGSQWWTLTWRACEAILELADDRKLIRFFRRTWVADELFFQTVVRRALPPGERIRCRTLTWYRFNDCGMPQVFYNGHEDFLQRQPFFFARKISPYADRLRARLDTLADAPGSARAFEDADIGKHTGEFESVIEAQAHGLPGRRRMGRVGDPALGDLDWNRQPYFVVAGANRHALAQARHILETRPGIVCHGLLMEADRIEFAGNRARFAGYGAEDVPLRDDKPQNFWVDIIHETPDRFAGYLLRVSGASALPDDGTVPTMVRAHSLDPRAHVIFLRSEYEIATERPAAAPLHPGLAGEARGSAEELQDPGLPLSDEETPSARLFHVAYREEDLARTDSRFAHELIGIIDSVRRNEETA